MTKTSDNKNELFDIVDENDKVINQATRGEVHGNPKLMHRSVGVVIFNSYGEIFLQQRSATKDVDPNKWTISCSGHVTAKRVLPLASPVFDKKLINTYSQAAHRELKEELGVDLEIKPVTKFIYQSETETEIVMLFQAKSDGPFKFNKEEIVQGKFFTRSKLNNFVKSRQIDISKWGKMALEKMGWIK